MRKTVDMLLASVSPCPMKTWMPLTLCVALAACSARAAAPRPDAGSATDAASDAPVEPADGCEPSDAALDGRMSECTPGATFYRRGEVSTCGPDARSASMTP